MTAKNTKIRRDHLHYVIGVWRERARVRRGKWVSLAESKIAEAEQALKMMKQ